MKWFRFYTEVRTDAKLRLLTDAEHRVWVNLLCYAADQPDRGKLNGATRKTLAIEVARGNEQLLARTLEKLERLHIVEQGKDHVHFIHFDVRQYVQDDEKREQNRVRQATSRARKRNNANVTQG